MGHFESYHIDEHRIRNLLVLVARISVEKMSNVFLWGGGGLQFFNVHITQFLSQNIYFEHTYW